MHQVIDIPGECPNCGANTCITNMRTTTATVHCHPREGDSCGWSQSLELDPGADGYTFQSVLPGKRSDV